MASIDGLGSGLDVSTIISQLMSIEKQPQQRLVTQRETVLNRATAWTSVETQLSALKSALERVKAGGVSATTAASSDPTRATIGGSATTPGIHSLEIKQLATTQRVTSAEITSGTKYAAAVLAFGSGLAELGADTKITGVADSVAKGTYGIEVTALGNTGNGGVPTVKVNGVEKTVTKNGNSITVDGITLEVPNLKLGTATVTISRTGADASVADVAAAANGVASPMTALVISDGGTTPKYRLVLSGTQTGAANNVQMFSTYTGALDNATLTSTATTTNPTGTTLATDAQVVFNNLTLNRSTNSLTDLVPGATVSLLSPGTTTLTVAADSGTSVAAGKAVVDALNGLLRQIQTSSKYDQAAKRSGPLTGDGGARSLARSLTDAVTQAAQANTTGITLGGAPTSGWSSYTTTNLGISMQKDGTYAFNSTAFAAALKDKPAETKAFVDAIATKLTEVVTKATATDGVVSTSKKGSNDRAAQLQKQVDQWDDRLKMIEDRLRRQYSSLDTALGQLRSQGSWLSSQIAGLPSGNG